MYKSALILTALFSQLAIAAPVAPPSADDVSITMLPTNPIVFTAPISYTNNDGHPVTINGPWFRMQLALNNQSSDFVTVIHLNVQVTGKNNGVVSTANFDFDPSSFDFTLKCEKGVSRKIMYEYFGEFAPHSDGFLSLAYWDQPLPQECSAQNPNLTNPVFYVGALPAADPIASNPGEAPGYAYDVTVNVEGWFGPSTAPHDRFQKTIYLKTQ